MAHRIKVKLGEAEFEAEGAEDKVQAQYDQFLAALEQAKTKQPLKSTAARAGDVPTIDDARITSIFELRPDDMVILRFHPPDTVEASDAITLLLFGYLRLKNQENVLATQLLRAAKQCGLGIDRIDKAVDPYVPQYILRGGQRKGTTYRLTTRGIARAQEVAAAMPV
jgi:hypothetical protein